MKITGSQQFVIIFLLSIAALAIFDAWRSGGLMLIGGSALYWGAANGQDWRRPSWAWALVGLGAALGLHSLFARYFPPQVFPLVMLLCAAGLLSRRWER